MPLASQIVALVFAFLEADKQVAPLQELDGVDDRIRKDFIGFVMKKCMVELEMAIEPVIEVSAARNDIDFEQIQTKMKISSREVDVLRLMVKGSSNREIAEELYISEHTVKNHITNIFHKLEVSDRAQAIAKIYKLGFNHR